MSERRVPITLRLDPEIEQQVNFMAEIQGRTPTALMREAVVLYLDGIKANPEFPGQVKARAGHMLSLFGIDVPTELR